MAFRRRYRPFGGRRGSRGNSKQIPRWTAQTIDQALTAAAPNVGLTLYAPGTTIGAGQYEEESKVIRVVGRYTVQATDNGTVLSGPVGAGIIKTQSTSVVIGGFNDPLIATELAARDWLRVMNVQVPVNAGPNAWQWIHEFDVKVQRRMKAEDLLRLVLMNGTGDDITITVDVRILIVIRM